MAQFKQFQITYRYPFATDAKRTAIVTTKNRDEVYKQYKAAIILKVKELPSCHV